MSSDPAPAAPGNELPRPAFTLLLRGLFFASGAAALAYEVVWFQMLRLVVGASVVSLGVLLASFMGGMCLGSLLLPRVIPTRFHPLRVFAALELGIAACAVAMPVVLPWLTETYVARAEASGSSVLLRAAVACICLLPPTLLMGATLPAISRWVESTRDGFANLGTFYSANLFGAVAGTLATGFWLLPVHDLFVATGVAVTLNVLGAGLATWLAARRKHVPALPNAGGHVTARRRTPVVYLVLALSGFTALATEVIWTRHLSLLLGASTYTFSLILATFLIGLGIGSGVGAWLTRHLRHPGWMLGVAQLGIGIAIAFSAFGIAYVLPELQPHRVFVTRVRELAPVRYAWDLARCTVLLLPGPFLWGMSFPLGLAVLAGRSGDAGRLVGGLYAANTVGAILGASLTSLFGISHLGTHTSQQVLVGVSAASALVLLIAWILDRHANRTVVRGLLGLGCAATIGAVVVLAIRRVPEPPQGLLAYGRNVESWSTRGTFLYTKEGRSATVAVSDEGGGVRNFHVSGKVVASTIPIDMRLQRMLGHLPSLMHGHPKSVLVVGCGAGVTAGSFVPYPCIERIVVCEIEPLVPEAAKSYFGSWNHHVFEDPRTVVIEDDARHWLATTNERFDIITSDPIHPWVAGAAALYSEEYYAICKRKLNPGGLVTQWVPLYETNLDSVKSQIGTFLRAFPDGSIWNSDPEDVGYDIVMLGRPDGMVPWDLDLIEERFALWPHVRESLAEVELEHPFDLAVTYAGQGEDLAPWLEGAEINRDRSLKLQYLAGAALDRYEDERIYQDMVRYRRYPTNLFRAPRDLEDALRERFETLR